MPVSYTHLDVYKRQIVASAGFSEPFYSFRNETFVHASRSLSIHNKIHVLSL